MCHFKGEPVDEAVMGGVTTRRDCRRDAGHHRWVGTTADRDSCRPRPVGRPTEVPAAIPGCSGARVNQQPGGRSV